MMYQCVASPQCSRVPSFALAEQLGPRGCLVPRLLHVISSWNSDLWDFFSGFHFLKKPVDFCRLGVVFVVLS